ncbi:MAG: LuxR C-terminal-related transcriptional regulator, partial [Anaerolineaceae bacterium]
QLRGLVIDATAWQANQAWHAGDWEAMRSAIAAGLAIDPGEMNLIFHKAMLHLSLGNLEGAREGIHRLVENMEAAASEDNLALATNRARVYVAKALSAASHDAGLPTEPGLAKRAGEAALSSPTPPPPVMVVVTRAALATQAFLDDDWNSASVHLAALERFRGTVYAGVVIDRYRGLLLQALGRPNEAIEAFESALSLLSAGYRMSHALTAFDYARALLGRGKPGDHHQAHNLLVECVAVAGELGMKPLLERAQALDSSLGSRHPIRRTYPEGLSEREVQVLQLIATGKTNAEIAEALVISPYTVARHVSHIFQKIGTAHRSDAAAWAVRHGLAG